MYGGEHAAELRSEFRRLQYYGFWMEMPTWRDVHKAIYEKREGVKCLAGSAVGTSMGGLTANQSNNMEPLRIASRAWTSQRQSALMFFISLTELFQVPAELVELASDGSRVVQELLNGDIDLEPEAWVSDDDLQAPGLYHMGPVEYAATNVVVGSTALRRALQAATPPNMSMSGPASPWTSRSWTSRNMDWFSHWRTLNSTILLSLLPAHNPARCSRGCFVPTQCQGAALRGCREIYQEVPFPLGTRHMEQLLEYHQLPFVLVNASRDECVKDWYQVPKLACMAEVYRPFQAHLRFQFPSGGVPSAGRERQLPVLHQIGSRAAELRLPEIVRWSYEFVATSNLLFRIMDYSRSMVWIPATRDEKLYAAACVVTRGLFANGNPCVRNGIWICSGKNPTCPPGEYLITLPGVLGKACKRCAVGAYCRGDGANFQRCPPGKSTASTGSKEPHDCKCQPGMGLVPGAEGPGNVSCLPCREGLYKRNLADTECMGRCPPHSRCPPGATDVTLCACEAGFYLSTVRPWRCRRCMQGARCPGGLRLAGSSAPNQTQGLMSSSTWSLHEPPVSDSGYYGYDLPYPQSLDQTYVPLFLKCHLPEVCLGRNDCANGTTGLSCRVCAAGWLRDYASGKCTRCPTQNTIAFNGFFIVISGMVFFVLMVRGVALADKDTDALAPIILKILIFFLLATETIVRSALDPSRLSAPGFEPVKAVTSVIVDMLKLAANFLKLEFSLTGVAHCWIHQGAMSGAAGVDNAYDLERSAQKDYFDYVAEIVSGPFIALLPLWAFFLPLVHLRNLRKSHGEFAQWLRSVSQMLSLTQNDSEQLLTHANAVIKDLQGRMTAKHSILGIWRPSYALWNAAAHAHAVDAPEQREVTKASKLRHALCAVIYNSVSLMMPFWSIQYYAFVKTCVTAAGNCRWTQNPMTKQHEWWHSSEPSLMCGSQEHVNIVFLSLMGLTLFGLGLPVLVCWVVARNLKSSEDWCFNYNLNGYTRYSRLTARWDVVILLRSASLATVSGLPSQVFAGKEGVAMMIFAVFLAAHSIWLPFDQRRKNLLNRMEMRSLSFTLLSAPIISEACYFDREGPQVVGAALFLLFDVMLIRFVLRVAREFVREARDAFVQLKKQAVYASLLKKKRAKRRATLQKQQHKWLDSMLTTKHDAQGMEATMGAAPGGDRATSRFTDRLTPKKGLVTGISNITGLASMMKSALTDLPKEGDQIDDDEDGWSDFSDEEVQAEEAAAKPKSRTCWRCLKNTCKEMRLNMRLLIVYVGLGDILWIIKGTNRVVKRIFAALQRLEERHTKCGFVLDHENQCCNFMSSSPYLHFEQRQEAVNVFFSYFECLLCQHCISRFPLALPEICLGEAAQLASTSKRSLKYKAIIGHVRRMVDGLAQTYAAMSSDEDLMVGLSILESKLNRWLNANNLTGRLVKVRSLETLVLQTQFANCDLIMRRMWTLAAVNAKVTKVDAASGRSETQHKYDSPVHVRGRHEGEEHGLEGKGARLSITSLTSIANESPELLKRLGAEYVIYENLRSGPPSPSHLADHWRSVDVLLGTTFRDGLRKYHFWNPLDLKDRRDRNSEDDESSEDSVEDEKGPRESRLSQGVRSCRVAASRIEDNASKEHEPWPIKQSSPADHFVFQSRFLDDRAKYALMWLQDICTWEILGHMGKQHDLLRSSHDGLADKIASAVAELVACKTLAGGSFGFAGRIQPEVLQAADGVLAALGLHSGSKLLSELHGRLAGRGDCPRWQRSHERWFHSMLREGMREVGLCWTNSGTSVLSQEQADLADAQNMCGVLGISGEHDTGQPCGHARAKQLDQGKRLATIAPAMAAIERRQQQLSGPRPSPPAGGRGTVVGATAGDPATGFLALSQSPAGIMLGEQDWRALRDRAPGQHGALFEEQLWLVLEEWRQSMLDWARSWAASSLFAQPPLVSRSGVPYSHEPEDYRPGPPCGSVDDPYLDSEALDLEECRRAFALDGELQHQLKWCQDSFHDFRPMAAKEEGEHSCEICDGVLDTEAQGDILCCMHCRSRFCEGCSYLSRFLAQCDAQNCRAVRTSQCEEKEGEEDMTHQEQQLRQLEVSQPRVLFGELKRMEGKFNNDVNLPGITMKCGEVIKWAQGRVRSGRSVFSMLLCKEGSHSLGRSNGLMTKDSLCEMCATHIRRQQTAVCSQCKSIFCQKCGVIMRVCDQLREEIARMSAAGGMDSRSAMMLCRLVGRQPLEAIDMLNKIKTSGKAVTMVSKVVHRAMDWDMDVMHTADVMAAQQQRLQSDGWHPRAEHCVGPETGDKRDVSDAQVQASLARQVMEQRKPSAKAAAAPASVPQWAAHDAARAPALAVRATGSTLEEQLAEAKEDLEVQRSKFLLAANVRSRII